jgi:hypothetical protein
MRTCSGDRYTRNKTRASRFTMNPVMLRCIEGKGRVRGVPTVTITKNEILAGLNKPDSFILTASRRQNRSYQARQPPSTCRISPVI